MSYAKHKPTAIITTDPIDPTFGERTRQNDIANAFRFSWIGGSRSGLIEGTGVQDLDEYIDFRIDGTVISGYTVSIVCECLTLAAGTTITPELWDVTGTPELVTTTGGVAVNAQAWTRVVLAVPAWTAALRYYRVRANKSNATNDARMIAYLEFVG